MSAEALVAEIRAWSESDDYSDDEFRAWMASLPPVMARMIERELSAHSVDGWRAHPAALMHHLTGDPWWLRPHVQFLSGKFRELIDGASPRQIWNLPGRAGKTRSVRGGFVWAMDRHPTARSIAHSYVIDLATDTSIEVRDALATYDELGTRPAPGRAEQNRWFTVHGGGMLATSWGSRVVGYGVNEYGVLGIDDPMKNWQEAHNENARRRANAEFVGTLRHRLDSEAAKILIVHHRYHKSDLTGHLVSMAEDGTGDQWDHVVLPAIAGDNDAMGREPGEVLDEEAFTLDDLRARHIALGSFVTAAVEQQDPQEEEGNELKRAWFRLEETLPERWDHGLFSWDLKLTDRDEGDYVVGQAWVRVGQQFWLLDQVRGKFDHATTANAMCLLTVRHPGIRQHVIEAAAAAKDVIAQLSGLPGYEVTDEMAKALSMTDDERGQVQELRRRGLPGLVRHPVKGSKTVRARTYIAPLAEAGNIFLNASGTWLPGLLDEWAAFPTGDYDDQVDPASQALQRLQTSQGGIASTTSRRVPARPTPASGRPRRGR